jgi:curved DNA-binding protein CbpA
MHKTIIDKNKDPRAGHAFNLAQKAYEELMDKDSRRSHDELLEWRDFIHAEKRKDKLKLIAKHFKTTIRTLHQTARFCWRNRQPIAIGFISMVAVNIVKRLLYG